MIIAIDGTSSSGKSTLSSLLAKNLKFAHLNTGAIYRAISLCVLKENINLNEMQKIIECAKNANIKVVFENGESEVYINGKKETKSLRSPEVSGVVAEIAKIGGVRECTRTIQHNIAQEAKNIVVEGRDIGSVVFPDAEIKLFITASAKERAKRRLNEYISLGRTDITLNDVLKELNERDYADTTRENSPLVVCPDAIVFDTTAYDIKSANKALTKLVKQKIKEHKI